MKIQEIQLKRFKRFTDTTISAIPQSARLVILAGPNGCGKSSLIDAVHVWHGHTGARRGGWDQSYHAKALGGPSLPWQQAVTVSFHPPVPNTDRAREAAIYVRSAYRNDPDFRASSLSRMEPAVHEHRLNRLIDNDATVGQNYQRLVSQGLEDAFERIDADTTLGAFREQILGDIRNAIQRLFPDLLLNSLGNPLTEGSFRFDKGESKAFLYKNLSGGEKAAFDLLLDLIIKRREYDDTVFFIDEPEAHMASGLQGALLSELYRLVPDTSQLWIATHSLGMMRKARDLEIAHPGTVSFLDFDGINFDVKQTIQPTKPDRPFWKRAMDITLDDVAGYVAPEQIVLCEGETHTRNAKFDSECYNAIFQSDFPMTLFLGAGNAEDIKHDPRGVGRVIQALAPNVEIRRLIDRDDRTEAEIAVLRDQGVRVLTLRHIESYLLSDEILTLLCTALGNAALGPTLLAAKATALQKSIAAGGAPDDVKRVAGDVYNQTKQLFPDHKLGGDKRAFMREFCAPRIVPETAAYEELKQDIFG